MSTGFSSWCFNAAGYVRIVEVELALFALELVAEEVFSFLGGEKFLKETFNNGAAAPEAPFPFELINCVEEAFAEFQAYTFDLHCYRSC